VEGKRYSPRSFCVAAPTISSSLSKHFHSDDISHGSLFANWRHFCLCAPNRQRHLWEYSSKSCFINGLTYLLTIDVHSHIRPISGIPLLGTDPTCMQTAIWHVFKTRPVFETWLLFQTWLLVQRCWDPWLIFEGQLLFEDLQNMSYNWNAI